MGALSGYTVIELAGIGPSPMVGMMLADMGANVIRVERTTCINPLLAKDPSMRGKRSIVLNLKEPQGRSTLLRMVEKADVITEGFRPGIVEELGVGPDECFARNPGIVYGRMTGWGQDGPLARAAGHDINYIALTGALFAMGQAGDCPVPPLNLVGDMGGGAMLLAMGILAALLECKSSGRGQVVDAAMVDGTAQLMWLIHGFHAAGLWNARQRGVNLLDGGAPFYGTYETSDGKYICIASVEPQFYAALLERLGLDKTAYAAQYDVARWPEFREEFRKIFRTRTQAQWCEVMEGTDVCFAPVLNLVEAAAHPHNQARNTYIEVDGYTQPAPAPRFSRTSSTVRCGAPRPGEDSDAVLGEFGFNEVEITKLRQVGILT